MQKILASYNAIFWDFDGVIKDSVEAKALAYESLFKGMDPLLLNEIKIHHRDNGGVSRYEKIPLYLRWAGFEVTQILVDLYCKRFSAIVTHLVIDSAWVPGVRDFLIDNYPYKKFFLITATPTKEIKIILSELGLLDCFIEIHGAPIKKYEVVQDIMHRLNLQSKDALLVGDSASDYEAATKNNLRFVLRCTALNGKLQKLHKGPSFEGLI